MTNTIAPLLLDSYKLDHMRQYPEGTSLVYSNLTPRKSRIEGVEGVIVFGTQYYVLRYLIEYWNEYFFKLPKEEVLAIYKRRVEHYPGPSVVDVSHIGALHDVGYLPILLKAIPEGMMVPFRVPVLTIRNTRPEFFWLTNMLETQMSNILWLPMTSATTAFRYRKVFEGFANVTGAPKGFVPWQGHDFSMRGLPGIEAAQLSGAAHLLSFTGTDSVPSLDLLETYYGADVTKELVGGSVPATEHSVMCMGEKGNELETFKRLITKVYPDGIVSIVSDTWDFWRVITEYLPALRSEVMGREGKVVIRPDSGDPVKVICGDPQGATEPERKGAIRLLYEVFGGNKNAMGFIELDPHIGLIYGDSITPERQVAILSGLLANGFASSNVVLGIGSYTYQYVTRDTYGFAMKATYGEVMKTYGDYAKVAEPRPIFKDPKTDDGTKKSAYGLLMVEEECYGSGISVRENVSWEEEAKGILIPIFKDGKALNLTTLAEIRGRVEKYL